MNNVNVLSTTSHRALQKTIEYLETRKSNCQAMISQSEAIALAIDGLTREKLLQHFTGANISFSQSYFRSEARIPTIFAKNALKTYKNLLSSLCSLREELMACKIKIRFNGLCRQQKPFYLRTNSSMKKLEALQAKIMNDINCEISKTTRVLEGDEDYHLAKQHFAKTLKIKSWLSNDDGSH